VQFYAQLFSTPIQFPICGYSNFKDSKKAQKLFSDSCTVSDEAFAMLLLRKNWKTWSKRVLDVNIRRDYVSFLNLVQDVTDNEHLTEDILSEYASNKTNKKFHGWFLKAINEYNELF